MIFLGSDKQTATRRCAMLCLLTAALLFVPRVAKAQNAPTWKPGVDYEINEIVSFNGVTYKCIQSHKSDNANQPPSTLAIWQPLGSAANCQAVPGAPTGVSTFSTTSTSTQLSWKPAPLPAGCTVNKYTVYQNGVPIGVVESTTFTARHLAPATQYLFTVTATDTAGTSELSAPGTVTTKQVSTCRAASGRAGGFVGHIHHQHRHHAPVDRIDHNCRLRCARLRSLQRRRASRHGHWPALHDHRLGAGHDLHVYRRRHRRRGRFRRQRARERHHREISQTVPFLPHVPFFA